MTFPVPECGTLMSLTTSTSEQLHDIIVAAGSENKIVVLKVKENEFEVLKVRIISIMITKYLHKICFGVDNFIITSKTLF